jgi:predicted CoA-binding protein
MMAESVSLQTIEDFLAHKRIAMVGISRDPKNFSVTLFEEFRRRGYDVVPVNPHVPELFGQRCFARVQDIQPPVQAALLITAPEITDIVVKDCAQAGIGKVWMYGAGGKGAVSCQAVQFCEQRGIQVVPGQCPFMFWRDAGTIHGLHGFLRKVIGTYPHANVA